MDFMQPSPSKRPRTTTNSTNLQLTECVRQFKLPRQFPSMISIPKSVMKENASTMKRKNAMSLVPVLPFCNGMKFVPNREANISNKPQKLKLKSPDGRDLGEFDVQLLPLKHDGKTITFTKHRVLQNSDQSNAPSISKRQENEKEKLSVALTSVQSPAIAENRKDSFNLTSCLSKSREANSERKINVLSAERLSEAPNKFNDCREIKEARNVNRGNKSIVQNQKDKTSSVQLLRGNHKVFVIRADKQSRINFHSIQRDIRNLVQVAPHKKLVILRTDKYPRLAGNNKVTSLNVDASKNGGNVIAKRFKPARLNLDCKSSVDIEVGKKELDEKRSKENGKIINLTVNADANGARVKQWPKSGSDITTNVNASDKCGVKSERSLQTNVTNRSTKSAVSEKQTLGNARSNRQNDVKTRGKKILPSIRDRVKNPEQTYKDLTSKSSDKILCDKNSKSTTSIRQNCTNFKENIMVIVHSDTTVPVDKKAHCARSDAGINSKGKQDDSIDKNIHRGASMTNGIVNIRNGKRSVPKKKIVSDTGTDNTRKSVDIQKETLIETDDAVKSNDKKTDGETMISESNAEQNQLTSDLSILQKALSSVKDEELRAKAIKALADCGIGIEKQVPLRPPPDLMSVHDTQTQTNVFGLLDTEDFVTVTEDSQNLLRVKQKTHQQPLGDNVHSQYRSSSTQNLALPVANSPLPFSFDLDSTLDSFLIDNLGTKASRIKRIFSARDPIIERAYEQLEKDFVTVKQRDENGMLNIHKAVLNDSICEVQRQLMVLKACTESVDLLTGGGKTSLELAFQYDVNPQIIRLLLEAGAQPVSSKTGHNSALIIASRMSSPLLSELISKVSTGKLLNTVDSEGFAALHYCAQLGNVIGVDGLIHGGADINLRDSKSGRTPLFHALENHRLKVAQHLLDNGAISNIINFAGQTVLALLDESFRNHSLIESIHRAIK